MLHQFTWNWRFWFLVMLWHLQMGGGSVTITELIYKKQTKTKQNFSVMSLHLILQKFKESNGHKECVVLSQVCLSE